jgi:hypothetical protein
MGPVERVGRRGAIGGRRAERGTERTELILKGKKGKKEGRTRK